MAICINNKVECNSGISMVEYSTDAQFVQPWNIPKMRNKHNYEILNYFIYISQMHNFCMFGIFYSGIFHGCAYCASAEYSIVKYSMVVQIAHLWNIYKH